MPNPGPQAPRPDAEDGAVEPLLLPARARELDTLDHPHYPRPAPIEAYGNGGFRFAGMSHRGSLLCLPSGIYGWTPDRIENVCPGELLRALESETRISMVLLGMGRTIAGVPQELRRVLAQAGIGLEPMDTGAAVRTYNVLLAEVRPVAAALIAVE